MRSQKYAFTTSDAKSFPESIPRHRFIKILAVFVSVSYIVGNPRVMIVERNKDEIIFRLPASTDIDELQDFADLLEFFEISRNSKASQIQVDELVNTIKKNRWEKTKKKTGI